METTKSLNREEINRNCERTLILLRSTKPEAADLMLTMLNDSILKRYGDSKQAIDVSKFSKLNSEKSDDNNTKVPNKKPKLKKNKKEKNHQVSKNEKKLNELSNDVNIQGMYQKTKHNSNKFNNKISKHNKSKTKIIKDEDNLRNKNNHFEKANIPSDEYDEEITNNTSQTFTAIKNFNNKAKSNTTSKQNENSEHSKGTQESKIHETQNTENSQPKGENESFGMTSIVKRAQWQQKYTAKVRSHKKPLLHELSSRQRIQAVLEKGINNK